MRKVTFKSDLFGKFMRRVDTLREMHDGRRGRDLIFGPLVVVTVIANKTDQ